MALKKEQTQNTFFSRIDSQTEMIDVLGKSLKRVLTYQEIEAIYLMSGEPKAMSVLIDLFKELGNNE